MKLSIQSIPVLALGLLMLLPCGCAFLRREAPEPQSAPSPRVEAEKISREPLDPAWLAPSRDAFTLGPGDKLEIEIVGEPASRTIAPVGPDGKIYFHVLPGIEVWGLTPAEASAELSDALTGFYRETPRVTVTLREVGSKQIWLLGRLNQPGIYPLTGPITVLEAIASAGGPSPTPVFAALTTGGTATFSGGSDEAADLERSFVIRDGELLPVDLYRLVREGDMSQNIYLKADDLVYLPSAQSGEVHVLGEVGQPQAVPYTRQTTLLAALAVAGGPLKDAHRSQVAIVRGGINNPEIIVVDFDLILKGEASDVALEAHDIVYVPTSPYRVLNRYVDMILSTFARTVGVNAGARAVSRDQNIGISVPVN